MSLPTKEQPSTTVPEEAQEAPRTSSAEKRKKRAQQNVNCQVDPANDPRIVNVVRGKDLMSRLSLESIDRLCDEIAEASLVTQAMDWFGATVFGKTVDRGGGSAGAGAADQSAPQSARGGAASQPSAGGRAGTASQSASSSSAAQQAGSCAAARDTKFDASPDDSSEKPHANVPKPPGKYVLHLQCRPSTAPPRLFWTRNLDGSYNRIFVAMRMVDDHLPNLYLASLCDAYFNQFCDPQRMDAREAVLFGILDKIGFNYRRAYELAQVVKMVKIL